MLSLISSFHLLMAAVPSVGSACPPVHPSARPPVRPSDTAHVVIVATTDLHGHVTDWDYVANQPASGGLTRVASLVDSLKARYPGQVVVLDAGDVIQGDPFATYFARIAPRDPNPVIEAMSLTGYDAATPGNHEFDWGVGVMRRAVAGAAFPYVSGNIYTLPGDTLLFKPYVVLQRQGVRIGITGFTTPGAAVWNGDHLQGKLRLDRIPAAAARVIPPLRRESDLVVALIHSGLTGPASYDTTGVGGENEAASLAGLPVRPDLVVVGHSHREMRDSVRGGVHFVQPRQHGGSVSITHVDLVREEERWRPFRIRAELVSTARTAPSPRLAQRLAPAHEAVLNWTNLALGEAAGPMPAAAARLEPTPILNFVNTVQLKRTGADLSAASAFDLRAGFDSGTIRVRQLVALYPFDNTLRAVRISGTQLKDYLEHSARYYRTDPLGRISINDSVPGYDYDVIAGARYDIDLRRAPGDRIRNLSVRRRPVTRSDSFTLAVNSHRQTGAGGYSMLRGVPVVYDKGENIRDLLIEEIKSRKVIDPAGYAAREWRLVPEGAASAVRALFRIPPRPLPVGPRDTILLRVLATTDLHGSLLPKTDSEGRRSGGLAALKGLMDSLDAECRCPVLRLDAGDQMQGTFLSNVTAGRSMIEALNQLDLTAAAIGNHEFDWSVDTLRRRMAESRYSWLAANVFDSASGRRPVWVTPYRIVQAGDLKVAVVGYITAEAKEAIKAEWTAGIRFGEGVLPINDVLTEVRALRPDVTILLAHAGAECNGAVCAGEMIQFADAVEARTIDLIVAGHTHELVNTRIAGVPIVEAGVGGKALAVADLVKTPAGGREVRTRIEPVNPDSIREDSVVAALIEGYRRAAESTTKRVVATIKLPLARRGSQYPLGHMIAEARRSVLRADLGLVGNGGIRADLQAGPVSFGQLYEVQPFQNPLVRLTLTGSQLQEVLEHALAADDSPSAHISGAVVRYDSRRPPGRRVRSVELQGRALRRDARYTLAVDEFLAGGGDGYNMLIGRPVEPGGILDVDAVITYLRRLPQPVEVTAGPGFVSSRR
jgi:2',3'-cyclic-nucleotide 2'-phosphodiesterase / 3'-nucleotidase / 5'-nucleotidase